MPPLSTSSPGGQTACLVREETRWSASSSSSDKPSPHHTTPGCTSPHHTTPGCTFPHHIAPHQAALLHITPHHIALHVVARLAIYLFNFLQCTFCCFFHPLKKYMLSYFVCNNSLHLHILCCLSTEVIQLASTSLTLFLKRSVEVIQFVFTSLILLFNRGDTA